MWLCLSAVAPVAFTDETAPPRRDFAANSARRPGSITSVHHDLPRTKCSERDTTFAGGISEYPALGESLFGLIFSTLSAMRWLRLGLLRPAR